MRVLRRRKESGTSSRMLGRSSHFEGKLVFGFEMVDVTWRNELAFETLIILRDMEIIITRDIDII